MSGFEIFGVVAGVIGFVPLVRELAGKDDHLETIACEIVDTMNKHADFYMKFKASLNDDDIAQSLKRVETLLQSMKDRCDEERCRRASVLRRMKVLFSNNDLKKDICDLRDRLNEEHRSWMADVSLRIYQCTETLQKQLANAQLVIVQEQAQNLSLSQQLIQRVITDRTNALSTEFKSVTAYVPRRRGSKILLTAEDVHGLQNKPPERIIRKYSGIMTIQFCSPAYRINMRSIREFYETKMTFSSTRDENVIGTLRDTADCILEQLQNEECSLAHHVRALSILLWLVELLAKIGISLDRQTRDEVEGCANALTGEYLRQGGYNEMDVCWALKWASKRTMQEVAPQVPDSFFENIPELEGLPELESSPELARLADLARLVDFADLADLVDLADLTDLTDLASLVGDAGLADLADLADFADPTSLASVAGVAGLTHIAGLQGVVGIARLARLKGLQGLQGLRRLAALHGIVALADLAGLAGLGHQRLLSPTTYMDIPRCASIARLALDDTPESEQ